jgi:hypothetical protein
MKHIEAVIRMFEPSYDVRRIAARRPNRTNGLFKRGTLFRTALDALRKAPEPMTTREGLMGRGWHPASILGIAVHRHLSCVLCTNGARDDAACQFR